MKKRTSRVILTVLLCLCLWQSACAQADKLQVTATFYPLYLAAINVARGVEGVEINCLTPPQAGCLHDYQMTTDDRRALESSDVVIFNGAGLEGFLDKLLPTLDAAAIEASEGVALLPGSHGVNPHLWVSIEGMIAEVQNIAEGMAEVDPENAELYRQNAGAYVQKLTELKAELLERLAPIANQPIVTFHEAFDYFADEFSLRVVATVGEDEGNVPSPRALANTAVIIRAENVRALFTEPQYDDASVEILSRETGVPIYLLDPVVSGEAIADDYDAYLRIMRQNASTLVEALQ